MISFVKLFMASAAFVGITAYAMAQELNRPVTLTVTPAELKVLGDALGMLPYKEVAPLMGKLQGQVIAQQQPDGGKSDRAKDQTKAPQ